MTCARMEGSPTHATAQAPSRQCVGSHPLSSTSPHPPRTQSSPTGCSATNASSAMICSAATPNTTGRISTSIYWSLATNDGLGGAPSGQRAPSPTIRPTAPKVRRSRTTVVRLLRCGQHDGEGGPALVGLKTVGEMETSMGESPLPRTSRAPCR